MTDLIAIDILIETDAATRAYARALNRRLTWAMPQGFALDDTHLPHITLLGNAICARRTWTRRWARWDLR